MLVESATVCPRTVLLLSIIVRCLIVSNGDVVSSFSFVHKENSPLTLAGATGRQKSASSRTGKLVGPGTLSSVCE